MLLNSFFFLQGGKLRQSLLWPGSLLCPRDSAAKSVSTFFPQEAESLSPYAPYPEGQAAGERPCRSWTFLAPALSSQQRGSMG